MSSKIHRFRIALAAVPGTPQAEQAVAEAAKPKRAVIAAGQENRPEVPYVGEPSFVDIEATGLRRAENTPYQVIMHNNFYYLCLEGAWYSSTNPSSGEVAYTSTSGYYNRYYTGSTMVYGTGWYYPGYHNRSAYWRYPYTYGYGAWGPHYPYGYHRSNGTWTVPSGGSTTTARGITWVRENTKCRKATITKVMNNENSAAQPGYRRVCLNTGSPQIAHQETVHGGEFTIGREAIMTYRKSGEDTIVVNHTRVAKQSEGRGLARLLYRYMVEFARERKLKVDPACSYVVAMFQRFPEDRDVLG